ncbi:hypothetical protein [Cognataquiflexum nitidum]|uniref:hypothetical protein n=1 Tax=Cognataquiflexum nitidum TaxID=2922272 RepID=UPI001F1358C3|nr:hypothetical protein [Cognataquiflexum nitidum]
MIDIGYWWIFSGEGLLGYLVNGYLGVEDRYSWILDIGGYYGRTNLILIDIGYWWIFLGRLGMLWDNGEEIKLPKILNWRLKFHNSHATRNNINKYRIAMNIGIRKVWTKG